MQLLLNQKNFCKKAYNKALKAVPRCARHWTSPVGAFATQIVRAALRRPLALR